jgi:integrator complex subunit 11
MDDNSHLLFIFDLSVIPVDLKQTIQVDRDLVIRAYYAGHVCAYTYASLLVYSNIFYILKKLSVGLWGPYSFYPFKLKVLGAAMIYAKVGDATMVYTGDYNMTPDRHLGAAQIDRPKLDLLITEYVLAPIANIFLRMSTFLGF